MVAAIAPEPVFAGTSLLDTRHRPAAAVHGRLPDAAPAPARNETPSDDVQTPPRRSGASHFAAAVIAGALSPTPATVNELVRRIGLSDIPPESEARLKDILA